MRREALRESDLRSLERRSMYSIFTPLDSNERLPRELVIEAKRHGTLLPRLVIPYVEGRLSRRGLVWVLWPPALFLVMIIAGWTNLNGLVVLGMLGAIIAALSAFTRSERG